MTTSLQVTPAADDATDRTDDGRRQPNIILITSDQQRGDCFGFEGRGVGTPHLDRLAREGTRFSSAITPNLVCQPSRASILTGLLPLTHGVRDNGIELDEQIASAGFAGQLSRAGYRSAFVGKAHLSTWITEAATGRPENRASAHLFADDWHGPYMGFDHVELCALGHFLADQPGLHYERWLYAQDDSEVIAELYGRRLAPDVDAAQTWHSALPVEWHNSTWTADRAIAQIREHGDDPDQPLCMWVSFPDPHHPFDCPEPWSRLHDPSEVDLPKYRTRDLDRRPWWHKAAMESVPDSASEFIRRFRAEKSRVPDQSDEQLAHLIANYYGMISLVDHNVGRIVGEVDRLGLTGDTYVVFTSDHGDWLGDHGLLLKGPMAYEGLLRVGLIVRGPGVVAGTVVDEPVSTIDLAATFSHWSGVDIPQARHSTSLVPLLGGGANGTSRDHAFMEWPVEASRCGVALDLRTVRTASTKLTLEMGSGAGELYDLQSDPHERHNLFDLPVAATLRSELVQRAMARPDDQLTPRPSQVGMA